MRSILAVGQDADLLTTRAQVLRHCHAEVTSASADNAVPLLKEHRFDLLVLCHSIAPAQTKDIIEAAREINANLRILRVLKRSDDDKPAGTTSDDEVLAEPEVLTARVSEILGT